MKRKDHPSEDSFDTHHQPDLKRVRLDQPDESHLHQHNATAMQHLAAPTEHDMHGLHHPADESVYHHFHANTYAHGVNPNAQYAHLGAYDYGTAFAAGGAEHAGAAMAYQHDPQHYAQNGSMAHGATGEEHHDPEAYHGLYARMNHPDSFALSNMHGGTDDDTRRAHMDEQEWMHTHQQQNAHTTADHMTQQSQLAMAQQFQPQAGPVMPDQTGFDQFQQVTHGYQYLAYMSNNGKYEPVLIYYDQDGQARIQPAPELHEQLQEAMQYQPPVGVEESGYDTATEVAPTHKKKSSSSNASTNSDNQEKASVAELAKRIGLLKNEHKEWRFRDQKRTLLLKLSSSHQHYIENSNLDEILLRRLPHKITPTEFAKRIWLLVFHTVVAEGSTPKFWDRVSDREYLENHLDEEFKTMRNAQFATEVYNAIMRHDCTVQEAINSVAFQLSQQELADQQQVPGTLYNGAPGSDVQPVLGAGIPEDGEVHAQQTGSTTTTTTTAQ